MFYSNLRKICLFGLLSGSLSAIAQNNNAPSSFDIHDIKITGYLQTQYQKAQSAGISSFSGGDFATNSDNRFIIRRGRLKIDRVDEYTNIVFQIDATQNGLNLMDAFIQFHSPKSKEFLLTAGLFNRPFGYSIIYSSGYRDFPERARVFQTLMPRERDLGAMITYQPQGKLKFIVADLAVMNGSGLSARDYDSKKDLVGNLNFKFDSLLNKKVHLGFGASFYKGTVRSSTDTYFESSKQGFIPITNPNHVGKNLSRNYSGVNLQLKIDHKLGSTQLKTEYVKGVQPGLAASSSVSGPLASQSFANQPSTNLYQRKFEGYYFWLTQSLFHNKASLLLAYDVYDPNSAIRESSIGLAGTQTTAGDIRYSTLGYGFTYAISSRLKLTLYQEHIKNDKTQIAAYQNDIKDDVFTTRLQYRW